MAIKTVVVLLVGLALASVHLAEAQQGKVYRVGVLAPPGKAVERVHIRGFRDGLKDVGYIEGKNLQLNIPNVKTYDELRPIASRYVEEKMDVIVTDGGTATGIAKEATKEIPIIFIWGLPDPVGAGVVKSLAHPETNITGLTSNPGPEIQGKRLELFKEAVPTLQRVVLLYNARGENPGQAMSLAVVKEVAPKLGLRLTEKPIRSAGEADEAVLSVSKETTDGIFTINSGLFGEPCKKFIAIAMQKRLPLTGCAIELGALLSYEPDRYRNGHRGAWYVDRILKGARPQDLPVEAPMKFELMINLKTAKQIGVTIPQSMLYRADKVIK
jgi:putative tryptophan/tyrosine transport system substrate-binding protein